MAKPKSSTLFHFTKSLDIVKNILNLGYQPRYSLEDVDWVGIESTPYVAYPLVCFCDIPLTRLGEHVGFYGSYGLGMTKEWALANGLNPVMYIVPGSPLSQSLQDHLAAAVAAHEVHKDSEHIKQFRCTIAFSKPISGTMIVKATPVQKEFYQESEWRHLARHQDMDEFLTQEEFNDPKIKDKANEKAAEKSMQRFSPSDVKYIFVRSDSDIPDLVNFINDALDRYPSAELKILTTRIVSLEQIEKDM